VDQSTPDFFVERGRNHSQSIRFLILDILTRSGDIRDRSLKLAEIVPNFACFGPPISSGGGGGGGGEGPEFLDLHYKAHPDCDHVESFTAIGRGSSEVAWRKK